MFRIAVCGLHLRGLSLNWQLTELGATFVHACKSSTNYRLYVFQDATGKPKPGMIYVTDGSGASIDLEVWELPSENFGAFMQQVPAPLGIGTIQLEDKSSVKGFICEGWVAWQPDDVNVQDITHLGGWRQYLESVKKP